MTVLLPQYHELLWPAVVALGELGGSASIGELNEQVINNGDYTEEQQAVLHKDGPSTEIEYRIAWARTYLKGMGLADNSTRGVWSLTDRGRQATLDQIMPLRAEYIASTREARRKRGSPSSDETLDSGDWREELIARILRMDPQAFERLAVRLLREAGFVNVNTTPASNDEGIDAVGVYRVSLISFQVYVQCKRYRNRAWDWTKCATSAAPWRAAGTRVYSSPRPISRSRPRMRRPATEPHQSTSSMANDSATYSSSTPSGFR